MFRPEDAYSGFLVDRLRTQGRDIQARLPPAGIKALTMRYKCGPAQGTLFWHNMHRYNQKMKLFRIINGDIPGEEC